MSGYTTGGPPLADGGQESRKPVGYIVAGVLFLIAIGGIIWGINGFQSTFDEPDPLVGGQLDVAVEAGETQALWVSGGFASGATAACDISGPGTVSHTRPSSTGTLSVNGRSYVVDSEFTVDQAGTYTVSCPEQFANTVFVGPPLGGSIVAGVLGTLLGVFCGIAAIVVLVVTIILRRRRRRAPVGYGAPPPYSGPPPYGAPPEPYGAAPQYGTPPQYGAPPPPPQYGAPPASAAVRHAPVPAGVRSATASLRLELSPRGQAPVGSGNQRRRSTAGGNAMAGTASGCGPVSTLRASSR